jgi:hypothetical protein
VGLQWGYREGVEEVEWHVGCIHGFFAENEPIWHVVRAVLAGFEHTVQVFPRRESGVDATHKVIWGEAAIQAVQVDSSIWWEVIWAQQPALG